MSSYSNDPGEYPWPAEYVPQQSAPSVAAPTEERATEARCAESSGSVAESNAWRQVWNRWKDHAEVRTIARELAGDQIHGCASILNEWIERMVEAKTPNNEVRDAANE